MLTGLQPNEHGIVANGWHERNTNETFFWRQSNNIVQGEKVWDSLRAINPDVTVANLFWWFNMYSSADFCVTPRPIYRADGIKIPDLWTNPSELRTILQKKLSQFPLFSFWGPSAGIESSQWIAEAAIEVDRLHSPTLSFVYLPHLDYPLQRLGPNHPDAPKELSLIDSVVGNLIDYYTSQNIDVCVLSEYGIEEVEDAVAINRILRKEGFLSIRNELDCEYLDAGASEAFAVPDHQIAHVYVKNHKNLQTVSNLLMQTDGVEFVYSGNKLEDLSHNRCGDIVAISNCNRWFSHDWWFSDCAAPDYQTTVDIHRKPGYDPRELCFAEGWRGSAPRIAIKLLLKKLGQRSSFDIITLDPKKIRGSHGRTPMMGAPNPILIAPQCAEKMPQSLPSAALKNLCIDWVNC
jgi:predicted AlkP superfamily pyrophosphatase or phosphodiesterase